MLHIRAKAKAVASRPSDKESQNQWRSNESTKYQCMRWTTLSHATQVENDDGQMLQVPHESRVSPTRRSAMESICQRHPDVENQESIEPCNLIMTRYERTPMQPWMLSSNLDSNLLKKRRMCSKTVRSGVTATKQDSGDPGSQKSKGLAPCMPQRGVFHQRTGSWVQSSQGQPTPWRTIAAKASSGEDRNAWDETPSRRPGTAMAYLHCDSAQKPTLQKFIQQMVRSAPSTTDTSSSLSTANTRGCWLHKNVYFVNK